MSKSRNRLGIGLVLIIAVAAALLWRYRAADDSEKSATSRPKVDKETARKLRQTRAKPIAKARTRALPPTGPVRLTPATVTEDLNAKHGSFTGRVINWGSGKGVAGAEVVFAGAVGASSARTNAAGEFEFTAAKVGHYRVAMVSAKGYLPFAPEWGYSPIEMVARPGRRVSNIVLYLTPAIPYVGVVVDADKQPVKGASVRLLNGAVGRLALAPMDQTFTSDEKGEFTFTAPDFATLEARHATGGLGRARVDGSVQISRRMTIQLDAKLVSYQADGVIEGRVVDKDGSPIADAVVRAFPSGGQRLPQGTVRQSRTKADGTFTATGLDKGSYRLRAQHRDYADSIVSAATGNKVTIAMKAGGVIVGNAVRNSDGDPVVSFAVVILKKQRLTRRIIQQTTFVSADGAFRVTGLSPGDYLVRAIAHGYAPSTPVKVTVANSPGRRVTLKLPQGGQLTGKVIDAESKQPLENAKISVENSFGRGASAMSATVVTDDKGEFSLAGLPLGRSSVTVAAYNHHRKIVGGFVVTEGAKVGPITIALTPTKPGEKPRLELAGLGIVLRAQGDGLLVQKLIDGGGGKEAGLVVGDIIIGVEGELVSDSGMSRAIQRIRGPVNTKIGIKIRRADGSTLDVLAVRRKIRV